MSLFTGHRDFIVKLLFPPRKHSLPRNKVTRVFPFSWAVGNNLLHKFILPGTNAALIRNFLPQPINVIQTQQRCNVLLTSGGEDFSVDSWFINKSPYVSNASVN
jgi:hypothetical protein